MPRVNNHFISTYRFVKWINKYEDLMKVCYLNCVTSEIFRSNLVDFSLPDLHYDCVGVVIAKWPKMNYHLFPLKGALDNFSLIPKFFSKKFRFLYH